jgi:anti-sigma factor RsiW
MNCKRATDEKLEEYFLGRLDDEGAETLEEHLLGCDDCALKAAYTEAGIGRIKAVMAGSKAIFN